MSTIELTVPDIGDATDVDVIEVLVSVGDTIEKEQSLITLESDKASMEIPAAAAGVVKEILVKVGDKVSEGAPIVVIEAAEDAADAGKAAPARPQGGSGSDESQATKPARTEQEKPATAAASTPSSGASETDSQADTQASVASRAPQAAASYSGKADLTCDVVVIGAGPGGYSAAFRAADLGLNVTLVERYDTLGGVCLNVGCIPSKALLHTAATLEAARKLAEQGIVFSEPEINLDALREHKESVVNKLTGGLAGMAKARKVNVVTGVASFLDPHHIAVRQDKGAEQVVRFESAIIAAGSRAVHLPFLPDDPRVIDSTGALTLPNIPKRMLVIGGGIIGLEMATVYSALGARVDVVEMMDSLMGGADADLVKVWQKMNAHRFDNIMLETKTTSATATKDGIEVSFEGKNAPDGSQVYDLVLQSAGRVPNGNLLDADKAGIDVTDKGFIPVDKQMRTDVSHIYAIGDIVGQPMLAHKATHEAHVAAEVIAGQKSYFDARVIPSVAYTDPEIAWVGLTEADAKEQGVDIKKGLFPWAASGRAIANTRDEGFTKLIFDAETQRVLGGGIVGTNAGELISEIALAIEMGADVVDIAHTIHPHPTLAESVGMAAQVALGSCTDLPPQRRK